jgi:uncharacterized protein YjbI with pentapeptide repeats
LKCCAKGRGSFATISEATSGLRHDPFLVTIAASKHQLPVRIDPDLCDSQRLVAQRKNEVDLHGGKLAETDLSGVSLKGANLRRADLSRADLSSAVLTAATLDSANLTAANLEGANLEGASLRNAQWGQ